VFACSGCSGKRGRCIHFGVLVHIGSAFNPDSNGELGKAIHTSEMLQQLDFSQRTLGKNLLAEDVGDLLDSNTLTGRVVGRSA
jgi:hypothetical protein